jgi:SAM-dependent methyltransferase
METKNYPLKGGGAQNYKLEECRHCSLVRTIGGSGNDPGSKNPDCGGYYGKGANKFVLVLQRIRECLMRARTQKYLPLIPSSVKRPKVLDVGCAEGRLLKAFAEKGFECWGVEHPAYPEERFLEPERITYLKGNLDELDLPEEGFDLIFLWHVLEHLDEPDRAVRSLYEMLRPEGCIILAVPNFASLESRFFKGNWFHLDLPWHRLHFAEKSLRYLIEKNQLKISDMNSLCLEQGPYGFIQSLLNAMGWPRNELYEALKGSLRAERVVFVLLQALLAGLFILPGFSATWLASFGGRGSVLQVIMRKRPK